MLGYTDLVRRGGRGAGNRRQGGVLKEMEEGTERLQRVIQNLLLLCELRSSSGPVAERESKHTTDVNENIRELFNYWTPAAKLKSIRFRFCAADGTPQVAIDPLKLQHIVSNLLDNALN